MNEAKLTAVSLTIMKYGAPKSRKYLIIGLISVPIPASTAHKVVTMSDKFKKINKKTKILIFVLDISFSSLPEPYFISISTGNKI